MKSLNEWKVDNFAEENQIDEDLKMALHQLMGKDQLKVDNQLKYKLQDEIKRIIQLYPDVDKVELLRMIISAAGSLMMGSKTNSISIGNFSKGLGGLDEKI